MASTYYYLDIHHPITGEMMRIKAADRNSLSLKVQKQYERWERIQRREEKAEKRQLAFEKSQEVQASLTALNGILAATLEVDDRIDWVSLLDKRPYPDAQPTLEQFKQGSLSKSLSFIPAFRKKSDEQDAAEKATYDKAHALYEEKKSKWDAEQYEHNMGIKMQKIAYEKGETAGIESYISLVLDRSTYPDVININNELAFDARTHTLLIELDLPKKRKFSSH